MLKSLSLKKKLLTAIFMLSGIAAGFFALMAFQSSQALHTGKQEQTKGITNSIIDKIDRNLFERYGDVQAFAVSDPARSGDPERIKAFMNEMMGTYAPIYDVMLVTDLKGKVIAANTLDKNGKPLDTQSLIGKDYSGEAWFQAAIKDEIKPGTSLVEDPHDDADVGAVFKTSGRVMNFTAPIRNKDTGAVIGVWSNRMSWADVVEALLKEESAKVKSDRIAEVFTYIVSADGVYLSHPDGAAKELKSNMAGFADLKTSAGSAGVWMREFKDTVKTFTGELLEVGNVSKGYSIYPGKGWYAIMQIPASDSTETRNAMMILLAAVLIVAANLFAYFVVNSAARTLEVILKNLSAESERLRESSTEIGGASLTLANASTEQASALQETAASLEETSAMIKRTAESALQSRQVSAQGIEVATSGKESIIAVETAISDIDNSNNVIMQQINESNVKIAEIVKLIRAIGDKTKVINDIVFQTKLLSFNASVEAARAGEHGKGFAVVAAEIGNLAQMSGKAADEISSMLDNSVRTVESTVGDMKTRVETLVEQGKSKIESGVEVTKQCRRVFEDIVGKVNEISSRIEEITTASQEQSQGVNEITRAMHELDKVTHTNTQSSQVASNTASNLSNQAQNLTQLVGSLEAIVWGDGKTHIQESDLAELEPVMESPAQAA